MGVPDFRFSDADGDLPGRHGRAIWEWALAGAVVLPVFLVTVSRETTAPAVGLACLIAGSAIMFAASRSAFRRNQSWRLSALTWGVAFAIALTIYVGWGSYSEPLALPGDLNIVTLERGGFTSYRRTRIPPELIHDLWRFIVSILVFGVIAGTFEGASRLSRAQALVSGILLGIVWLACLLPITVIGVASIYAGTLLGSLFPVASRDFVLALSVIIGGAVCGLLLGRGTERVLRRGEIVTTNS